MNSVKWIGRILAGVAVLSAVGMIGACGGDDDDDNGSGSTTAACMVLCADTSSTCIEYPGLTEAQCQTTAESDCGAPAQEVVFMSGCGCPGFGDPGECIGVPIWAE